MKVQIRHMLNGEVRHATTHRVTSPAGLGRIVRGLHNDDGWGMYLVMTLPTLERLGGYQSVCSEIGYVEVLGSPLLVVIKEEV